MFLLNWLSNLDIKYIIKFTIQNVSIKFLISLSKSSVFTNLQYKMFLLN